jgi:CHAT domain-containing protein
MYAAAPARADALETLCGVESGTAPGGTILQRATSTAEGLLGRSRVPEIGDEALKTLRVSESGVGKGEPHILAAYCLAAGEAMRIGREGSQFQAQNYLVAALHYSYAAKDAGLVARVAYQLALASIDGPAVGGTRGALQSRDNHPEFAVQHADVEGFASNYDCDTLRSPSLLDGNTESISTIALRCSSEQAHRAKDARLAALSNLRLARLSLEAEDASVTSSAVLQGLIAGVAAKGLGEARSIADPVLRAELLGRLADVVMDTNLSTSMIDGVAAEMRAGSGDPGVQSYAAEIEGRIALIQGHRVIAVDALRRAVFLEAERAEPLRLPLWLLRLGDAEPDRRAALRLQAYRALEAIRPLLPATDPLTEESVFFSQMRPIFDAAVDSELAPGAEGTETHLIAAAQEIIEAYRQAEVQNVLGVDCVTPAEPIRPVNLKPGELLLYPIVLDDRVEILVAGSGQAYQRLKPDRNASRTEVSQLVDKVVRATSYGRDDSWRAPAQRLYQILIGPIEDRLSPDTTLVIVPDGLLRALPFAALLDGKGDFLIRRTKLDIAPALSYTRTGTPMHGGSLHVVAASLQIAVTLPSGVFPRLDGTAEEARVAAAVGQPNVKQGVVLDNFRKADLAQALDTGPVDVLHLATHAGFNGRSDRSYIVANGEAIPLSELRNLITGGRQRRNGLNLLVLSACETAVGDEEANMGLAGAAVQSGAVSAIASLWQVNDKGTVELMRSFYRNYRAGESKAGALRNAQLELIDRGGDFAEPNIWAAFTLLGGWR